MRAEIRFLTVVAVVMTVLSAAMAASAHTAAGWYGNGTWGSNPTGSSGALLKVFLAATRETASKMRRKWNGVSGSALDFNFEQNQSDYPDFPASSCPKKSDGSPDT